MNLEASFVMDSKARIILLKRIDIKTKEINLIINAKREYGDFRK